MRLRAGFEVTLPIPECVDDGVCVPFDLSNTGEHFDYSEADSVWRGAFGRTDSDVTCECGKTIHVVVKIEVEKKQEPLGREVADAVEQFFIESQLSYIENPGAGRFTQLNTPMVSGKNTPISIKRVSRSTSSDFHTGTTRSSSSRGMS